LGGKVFLGVFDNGDPAGFADADAALKNVSDMIRDGIKPDLTPCVLSGIEQFDDRKIIVLDVERGVKRPYFLSDKGLCPDGVYVRSGSYSVPATLESIERMIRESDGVSYEKRRSTSQSLTFENARRMFEDDKIGFRQPQLLEHGLINSDGLFTNLGLLLSDQCIHTIMVTRYQDTTNLSYKIDTEFSGSLFKQIDDAYNILSLNNSISSELHGLFRVDTLAYPIAAVREALVNSVSHRDYSFSTGINIKVFSDRMEFISPGGLFAGVCLGDIRTGFAARRNPILSTVLEKMRFFKGHASGIPQIFESYQDSKIKPTMKYSKNVFRMILPNRNINPSEVPHRSKLTREAQSPEESVMAAVRKFGSIDRRQAEELLGMSKESTGFILRRMAARGDLRREGTYRNTRYLANCL
jgi:ATP-dependent DNA helicase RecG